MAFPVRKSMATKGRLKCHRCKEASVRMEGNWRQIQEDQVFLCKSCDHTHQASLSKIKISSQVLNPNFR